MKPSATTILIGSFLILGAFALSGCVQQVRDQPRPNPTSASTAPGKVNASSDTQTLLTGDALTKSFEIPAGLSPDELGKTFIQRFSDWREYAAIPETKQAWEDQGDSYVSTLTSAGGDAIASGLLVDGYQSNPKLVEWVSNMQQLNAVTVDAWARTYKSQFPTLDKEPYSVRLTTDSATVVSQSADTITLRIVVAQHVNLNNRMNPESPSTLAQPNNVQDGAKFEMMVTFQTMNGLERVSSIGPASN